MALLDVHDVEVTYRTKEGPLKAAEYVSFQLKKGDSLGLIGESGCGKSTMAKAILRLLPDNGQISGGEILFQGQDLAKLSPKEMRKLRWKELSLVTQSAMNSLNPVYTVGAQIVEAIRTHEAISRRRAWERAEDLFRLVNIEPSHLTNHPHELSGGMKQRAIIAMALCLNPSLVIADEPPTALDVIVQDRILQQIVRIQKEISSSLIYISHDISVIAETCDYVVVMYGGHVMETAPVREFFRHPSHPYSLGMQNAFPNLEDVDSELISIPGYPPDLLNLPPGCRFSPRCPFADSVCQQKQPDLHFIGTQHGTRCHFPDRAEAFRAQAKLPETWTERPAQGQRGVGA